MASIRERTTSSGETTFSVLWRQGGRQRSKTFIDGPSATKFATLVDILGPEQAIATLAEQPTGITVAELAEQWFERQATRVTPRTLTDYRRDYENWVKPWFGHRAASHVDEADVQKWVDHMAKKLAPKSVADRHMILHSMFKFGRARSRSLVDHNPCLETELPKPASKGVPKGTTPAEFRAILAAARRRNPDAADLILFLGETGWRWSEAAALDVRDVEDNGEDVWVTVTRVFRVDGKYRQVLIEDAAKSMAGFRRIRLLPESRAMVRRRVTGKGPGDLVFTNPRGRHWSQNTFLRETWPRIVADANIGDRKPTPHWLRHMHVMVLNAAGANLPEIQRRIGHEKITTTIDTYGRMIEGVTDDAITKAAALMSGEQPTSGAPVVSGEVVQALRELG